MDHLLDCPSKVTEYYIYRIRTLGVMDYLYFYLDKNRDRPSKVIEYNQICQNVLIIYISGSIQLDDICEGNILLT